MASMTPSPAASFPAGLACTTRSWRTVPTARRSRTARTRRLCRSSFPGPWPSCSRPAIRSHPPHSHRSSRSWTSVMRTAGADYGRISIRAARFGRGGVKGPPPLRLDVVQRLAQLVTDNLARSGARNLFNEAHRMRNLVGRKAGPAVREQRFGLDHLAGTRHHEQCRHLAEMGVRNPDHRAIEHGFMRIDDLLYLSRRDVLAAANDELLESSGNGQKAVLVAAREIAGMVPALAQRRVRLLRLVVIARHDVGPAHDQLPFLRRIDVAAACGIDDAHGKSRQRHAARAHDAAARGRVQRDHGRGLGNAVAVEQRYSETAFELAIEGCRH